MFCAATASSSGTEALGGAVTQAITSGDVVVLNGVIGSGKTTFTKGFGRAMGIEDSITSPTFVLVRTYQGQMPLHHVDVYRTEHLQEVVDLGLLEMIDEGGVALIEWGNLAAPVLPRDYLEIRISMDENDEDRRNFVFLGVGGDWSVRETKLRELLDPWAVTLDGSSDGLQQ